MDLLLERCAGIDIGKDEVVACVRTPGLGGKGRRKETRTFRSFTGDLEAMADWFAAEGVTEVVMEATGSVLEAGVVCAGGTGLRAEARQRPPRQDPPGPQERRRSTPSGWPSCSSTACCGAASCRRRSIRELRDLTRYRKRLVQAHTAECQRIHKTLEDAGIKLDSVASDVLGVSGRAMLAALVAGERDPEVLAELAKGRLRKKIPELRRGAARPVPGAPRPAHRPAAWTTPPTSRRPSPPSTPAWSKLSSPPTTSEAGVPFERARDHLDTITGVGQAGRRDDHRRDRRRHDPLPDRRAPGVVGGDGTRQQHHRRQTRFGQDHQGRRVARATSSCSAPGRRPGPGTPTCRPSSGASPAASARRRPLSPSATPSSSSAGTSSPTTATTTTSAATTSHVAPTPTAHAIEPSSSSTDLGYQVTLKQTA